MNFFKILLNLEPTTETTFKVETNYLAFGAFLAVIIVTGLIIFAIKKLKSKRNDKNLK